MTPNQPYLIRAYYEWILDNELTPHLAVDATVDGVEVPMEHVKDGQIVLNLSPSACVDMQMGNDWIMFNARFGGVSRRLIIPVVAVLAIFARENGAGTVFMQESPELAEELPEAQDESLQGNKTAELQSVDDEVKEPSDAPKPPAKGRPTLKVVK